jgi:hypothetical protein
LRTIASEVVSFGISCATISSSTICSISFTAGVTSVVSSNFFGFLIFFLIVTSVTMSSCGFSSSTGISVVSTGFSGFLRTIASEVVCFGISCVSISSSSIC